MKQDNTERAVSNGVAGNGFCEEVTAEANVEELTAGGFGGRAAQAEGTTCAKAPKTLRPE